MDLKLTVAEAYVAAHRANKGPTVADSNVTRLKSFIEDTRNRREEGLATRNDQLSAELSLANARQSQTG